MLLVLLVWVVAVFGVACSPGLPEPGARGGDEDGGGGGPQVSVAIEPPADPDAAPRALWFHVTVPALPHDPRFVVASGEVGPAHLRQLAAGDLSGAFTERLLPVRSWVSDEGGTPVVTVAPAVLLEPGETYTLASGDPSLAFPIVVSDTDAWPMLSRVWPPAGASATDALMVWCGEGALAQGEVGLQLEPGGPAGSIRAGIAHGLGGNCARFHATAPPVGPAEQPSPFDDAPGVTGWLAPPRVEIGGAAVLLEPSPLGADAPAPPPPAPAACTDDAPSPFGPGCGALLDDRLHARAPDARLLWAIAGAGVDVVLDVSAGAPFVVAPLPPSSQVTLDVLAIDVAGREQAAVFSGITAAPMAHVTISEVLANPLGAEPQQEWVELHNGGLAPAELEGLVLADVGGASVLPAATLAPDGYALVVEDGFVDDDGLDPPVAAGALVLRVGKLCKSGLSNAGEPLELRDAMGAVLSAAPAVPKPKAGMSVARVAPLAPDGVPTSFAHATPTPGAPN